MFLNVSYDLYSTPLFTVEKTDSNSFDFNMSWHPGFKLSGSRYYYGAASLTVDGVSDSDFKYSDSYSPPLKAHVGTDLDAGQSYHISWDTYDYNYNTHDSEDFTLIYFNAKRTYGGGSGNNIIIGSNQADTFRGNGGNDFLIGGNGIDKLSGGSGDDKITGGRGNDILKGDAGYDIFVFNDPISAKSNKDTVMDFHTGVDSLWLDSEAFTAFGSTSYPTSINSNEFTINFSGRATTSLQHIIYEKDTGIVYYDEDGAGGQKEIAFAVLNGKPDLAYTDFTVF